jgi:hypothetical protein
MPVRWPQHGKGFPHSVVTSAQLCMLTAAHEAPQQHPAVLSHPVAPITQVLGSSQYAWLSRQPKDWLMAVTTFNATVAVVCCCCCCCSRWPCLPSTTTWGWPTRASAPTSTPRSGASWQRKGAWGKLTQVGLGAGDTATSPCNTPHTPCQLCVCGTHAPRVYCLRAVTPLVSAQPASSDTNTCT